MNEFASVLSANGILPGINAERKYLAVQRTPWMMPLLNDAEKRAVLYVYSRYVAGLKHDHLLSSDQLINDYLNYLETFAWNLRRESEGYDLIFVDELHLFNEQERLVLHYLTRSADYYPRLFMALDPRQAPTEVYAGYAGGSVSSGESGEADRALGDIDAVDLGSIHRFSPQILALVRHINNSYPALELGEDWRLDLSSFSSTASPGPMPTVRRHPSLNEEIANVLESARRLQAQDGNERTAIVLLDPLLIPRYEAAAADQHLNVCVLKSRDDSVQLNYVKRSIVLTAAEYAAGLQFTNVVVAGFVENRQGFANVGYMTRRFLSLLYLAISRSSGSVEMHVNDDLGGVPPVLESAAAALLVGVV
jgi:hypothetical protein